MGLTTTHGAFDASCSTFNNWRRWMAPKVGIPFLNDMNGFGGEEEWTEEMKNSDYYPLLSHEDHQGTLTVDECKKTARFLESILHLDTAITFTEKVYHVYCEQFLKGCQDAIEKNESIEFH